MHVGTLAASLMIGLSGTVVALQPPQPSIEVDPVEVSPGAVFTVTGADFQTGTVGIHLDAVAIGLELASVQVGRDGTFVVDVPVGQATLGFHTVIACRDIVPGGTECRETAMVRITVLAPSTTTRPTTTPPTTTSMPTSTTTAPSTTSRPTTTRVTTTPTIIPATTTTNPSSQPPIAGVTTSSTSSIPSVQLATTTTTTSSTTTSSIAQIQLATTTTALIGDLTDGEDGLGPDPTFDPDPQDLLGPTTTLGPEYAAGNVDNEYDIELTHIEVTQGLQNLANEFPLLADRPTAVRLHGLRTSGPISLSSAFLEVSRDGQVLDVLEAENNPVQFPEVFTRTSNDASPYFVLDDAYLDGTLTLRGLAITGDPTLSNDIDPANNFIQTTVQFRDSAGVTVHAFPLFLADDGTSGGDTPLIHDAGEGWIHQALGFFRLWPVAKVTFDPFNPVVGDADSGWDMSTEESGPEPFAALAAVHAANGYGSREMTMGMVHPDADVYWGGFAQTPGSVSWSKMSSGYSPQWPWHQRAGAIIAQELGHNAGFEHVPCAYTAGDPLPGELHGGPIDPLFPQSYSWPNCSIAPLDPEGFYGFDVLWNVTAADEPSIMTNNPSSQPPFNAAPFMSYKGVGKWLEPWHGCGLLNYVGVPCTPTDLIPIDDDTPGQGQGLPPIGQAVPQFSCDEFGLLDEDGDLCDFTFGEPFDPTALDDTDHELFVFATIDPDAPAATLRPGHHMEPELYDPAAGLGPEGDDPLTPLDAPWRLWDHQGDDVLLLMRDAGGRLLGVQTLDVRSANGHSDEDGNPLLVEDGQHGLAELLIRVPALPSLASFEVVTRDGTLATLAPGAGAPVIASFDVAVGAESATVTFDAADPDGDSTYALVQYRTNGAWRVVATPTTGEVQIDLAMLPGGTAGEFRLAVSDGVHQTVASSGLVLLPDRAPFATILAPIDEFTRPAGRILELRGSALDLEDRDDVDTVWSSDLDGVIGSGTVVTTTGLRVGRHTITFAVTDRSGTTAADTIVVEIGPTDLAPARITEQVVELFRLGPPTTDGTPLGAAGPPALATTPGGSSNRAIWWTAAVVAAIAAAAGGALVARRRR